MTSPLSLEDTHRDTEGQEMSPRMPDAIGSTGTAVHAPDPPDGSVELNTLPPPSTATHRVDEGHAMP
jgi:hypothetical protein